jgi:hypothetical protein
MPGYGLANENEGRGLLPWSWAVERLRDGQNYWLSTVRPDGAPHTMAVWGVWLDGAFYFSTGRLTRKVVNLAHDERCVLCTERADEPVILEGVAKLVDGPALPKRLPQVYEAKYGMGYPEDSNVYAVHPRVVFGLIEDAAEFGGSATRWEF